MFKLDFLVFKVHSYIIFTYDLSPLVSPDLSLVSSPLSRRHDQPTTHWHCFSPSVLREEHTKKVESISQRNEK